MNPLEQVFFNIVNENKEKITNALILELVEDLTSTLIQSVAEELKLEYEYIEPHLNKVLRNFEEKLKKVRKNAD